MCVLRDSDVQILKAQIHPQNLTAVHAVQVLVLARFGGAETYFIKYCTVVATVRVYLPCMHSVWGTALILRGDESVMHA